jgi:hypothetical protein
VTGRAARAARVVLVAVLAAAPALPAQIADSARVGPTGSPTVDTLPSVLAQASPKPPISPKKALIRSLIVPGWGQASLDRGTAGAIFVTIEVLSVAMLQQSKSQLHAAQRAQRDSIWDPANSKYLPNPLAAVIGPRQQAVEDWTILIIFNHLISAADAFVAAHLWNVPIEVRGSPASKQAVISTSIKW